MSIGFRPEPSREHEVVILVENAELLVQPRRIEQIADAHGAPGGLVFVRGPDPAAGGADGGGPARGPSRARSSAAW